jgi:hypothetical protein
LLLTRYLSGFNSVFAHFQIKAEYVRPVKMAKLWSARDWSPLFVLLRHLVETVWFRPGMKSGDQVPHSKASTEFRKQVVGVEAAQGKQGGSGDALLPVELCSGTATRTRSLHTRKFLCSMEVLLPA